MQTNSCSTYLANFFQFPDQYKEVEGTPFLAWDLLNWQRVSSRSKVSCYFTVQKLMHNLVCQKSFDQILSLCLTASVSSFPIEKFSLKIRSKQIQSRYGWGLGNCHLLAFHASFLYLMKVCNLFTPDNSPPWTCQNSTELFFFWPTDSIKSRFNSSIEIQN